MAGFAHLKELLTILNWSKDLLNEMFETRKSFSYKYDHALHLLDEAHIETLLQRGLLRRNGAYLEIDEQYRDFFEQVLEINEEINTAYVTEQIQYIKQQIVFYFQESNENRRYNYLKAIKAGLRKTGRTALRSILDLNRNIENAFKSEPNYKLKLAKLHAFDAKQQDISRLLDAANRLITEEEQTFFATATDNELRSLVLGLRKQLLEGKHNLIETRQQIIEYLNQVKQLNAVNEHIRKLKYLQDQFELKAKTDIEVCLAAHQAVLFEPRTHASFKLSLTELWQDTWQGIISEVAAQQQRRGLKRPVAEAIADDMLKTESVEEIHINLEAIKQGFLATGNHLFAYMLQYRYPRDVSFEEMVTLYCQLVSMYEQEVTVTDEFETYGNVEYALVKPRQ